MTRTWTDDDILRDDGKEFEALLKRVNASVTKLGSDRTEAARSNRDGWPVYAPEERGQRERDAIDSFEKNVRAEETFLSERIEKLERDLANLTAAQDNPLSRLATESLTRANALRAFVEADLERLTGRDLEREVEQIAAAGDPGTLAAWHHALLVRASRAEGGGRLLYMAAAEKLADSLRDPAITSKVKALNKRLEQTRAARQQVTDAARSIRVANIEARMSASGAYARF